MAGDVEELVRRVRAKDYAAQDLAKQVGPAATQELAALTRDDDDIVRMIAVYCLDAIGGPGVAPALVRALYDEELHVQAAAMRGLARHADASVQRDLFDAYDAISEPELRRDIALAIGRMGPAAQQEELRARWKDATSPEAAEGAVVALARLDDPEAKKELEERLSGSRGRARKRYLDHAEYVHAPWLLKPLGKILDDKTPVLRIGVDGRPELIDSLRACDLAVNLIAEISGKTFSFPIALAENYADEKLAEVRAYVDALP
jgi:HEAT repeat protein